MLDVKEPQAAMAKILEQKNTLMQYGNVFCSAKKLKMVVFCIFNAVETMVKRGGGMKDITARVLPVDMPSILAIHHAEYAFISWICLSINNFSFLQRPYFVRF